MAKEATRRPKFPPLPENGAIKLDLARLARSTGQAALSQEAIDRERDIIGRIQPELAMILSGVLVNLNAHEPGQIEPWLHGTTAAHWAIRTGCPDYAPDKGHKLAPIALDALAEAFMAGIRQRPHASTLTEQLEVGLVPGLQQEVALAQHLSRSPDQSSAFLTGAGIIAVAIGYDLHAQQSALGSPS